jgi:hypothetical protein
MFHLALWNTEARDDAFVVVIFLLIHMTADVTLDVLLTFCPHHSRLRVSYDRDPPFDSPVFPRDTRPSEALVD